MLHAHAIRADSKETQTKRAIENQVTRPGAAGYM